MLALLLSYGIINATDPPKLPAEIAGVEAQLITVVAETTEKVVKFKAVTDGLTIVPSEQLVDKKTLIAFGKAGRYRVWAWTGSADGPSDPAEVLLVIKGKDGPDIVPPVVPVVPDDVLYTKLLTAYKSENDKSKLSDLSQAYKDTVASFTANKPLTVGDVFVTAASKRAAKVGTALPLVRSVAGDAVGALLGDDATKQLTDSDVTAVVKLFTTLANYTEKLK